MLDFGRINLDIVVLMDDLKCVCRSTGRLLCMMIGDVNVMIDCSTMAISSREFCGCSCCRVRFVVLKYSSHCSVSYCEVFSVSLYILAA